MTTPPPSQFSCATALLLHLDSRLSAVTNPAEIALRDRLLTYLATALAEPPTASLPHFHYQPSPQSTPPPPPDNDDQIQDLQSRLQHIYDLEPLLKEEGMQNFDGYFCHWNEILAFCARNRLDGYAQSPMELLTRLANQRDEAHQILLDVWKEDEMGWITDTSPVRQCVKCGAGAETQHADDCLQGRIYPHIKHLLDPS